MGKMIRARRAISIGDKTFNFRRSRTNRTVTHADGVRTAVLDRKRGPGSLTITTSKSADAKNKRIGAYARSHKTVTVGTDGTKTVVYQKKGGGTVTKKFDPTDDLKEGRKIRRRRRRNNTNTNTNTNNNNNSPNNNGTNQDATQP